MRVLHKRIHYRIINVYFQKRLERLLLLLRAFFVQFLEMYVIRRVCLHIGEGAAKRKGKRREECVLM